MSNIVDVAIASASHAQLYYFASTVLGLDVGPQTNNHNLRAKIEQAKPGCVTIQAPPEEAGPTAVEVHSAAADSLDPPEAPAGPMGMHHRYDPQVELTVMSTADPLRAKIVTLISQGQSIMMKRGVPLRIPYRFYLCLRDAVEKVARDTDEIHPQTGLPIREFVDQHSYPYQVLRMPSDQAIAAWHERIDGISFN